MKLKKIYLACALLFATPAFSEENLEKNNSNVESYVVEEAKEVQTVPKDMRKINELFAQKNAIEQAYRVFALDKHPVNTAADWLFFAFPAAFTATTVIAGSGIATVISTANGHANHRCSGIAVTVADRVSKAIASLSAPGNIRHLVTVGRNRSLVGSAHCGNGDGIAIRV